MGVIPSPFSSRCMKQIFTMIMALLTGAVGIFVLGLGVQSVEGMPLIAGRRRNEGALTTRIKMAIVQV